MFMGFSGAVVRSILSFHLLNIAGSILGCEPYNYEYEPPPPPIIELATALIFMYF